nr:wax ester/triacylglycerol synthase family O-acyltransferase [Solirubrobacterales bacterium]
PLDASFLHVEDSSSHMHVACVMVFAGPPPAYEELLQHLGSRLHLVPRYRKRLALVPLGQGRPRWVDDQDFDLRFHVRRTALPAPGTETELQVLAGRVFSQPLRRDRPLWEIWLVEGLGKGRFALLSKTHHALVDGVSGLDILSVLFAPEEESSVDGERWQAQPAPSGAQLLRESLLERATVPAEGVRAARAVLRGPRRLAGEALAKLRGASAFAFAGLSPAPITPFNEDLVGPDRRFAWVRMSLSDVKAIKNSLGGTVNDVVLTMVNGALRRYLLRRGADLEGMTLKALVPVSVRAPDERGALGNKVSGMIAPLPVSCADPVASLQTIAGAMDQVKSSGQAIGAQALTELSGFAPANLISQAGRVAFRQRFINLVVTNIPGPQQPLTMAGREMLDIFPMVPLGSNLALGVAIVSYNGTLNFGLVGDFKVMHDLEDLVGDLSDAAAELAGAAGIAAEHPAVASSSAPPRSRGVEPWAGYDALTVAQIDKRLRGAGPALLGRVEAYEKQNGQRKGILRSIGRELARR